MDVAMSAAQSHAPLEIIDAHCHYWEAPRPERPRVDGAHPLNAYGPAYPAETIIAEAQACGIAKIVQVTPGFAGYDNGYDLEAAEKHPEQIAGVFILFDPLSPNVPERMAKARRHPKFWGIRVTMLPLVPGLKLTPAIQGSVTWLQDGSLDPLLAEAGNQRVPLALYAPHQASAIAAVARRYPNTPILLDHMGLRGADEDPFARWPEILALAETPNIWIKVSMFPEVSHEPFPFADVQPRLKELVNHFGVERLIWGSNYPRSKERCTYQESLEFALGTCRSFLGTAEIKKVFGETLSAVAVSGAGSE